MENKQLDASAAAAAATGGVATGSVGAVPAGGGSRLGDLPLAAQAPELRRQLAEARATLERLERIDPGLHARVSGRFADLAAAAAKSLDELESDLRNSGATADAWESFRQTRSSCTSLFDEVLAFVEGALVRQSGLDGGVCTVADGLLSDLSERTEIPWGRLTILAEREFLGELGEIVRLRFPEASVWSLPIAVHEFGHFIGPEIRRETYVDGMRDVERPFRELLRRERERTPGDSTRAFHLHEYFADLFATYAAGPAYPYACVVLRFDPGRRGGGGRHPAADRRVELMIAALAALDEDAGLAVSYGSVIDGIRELWSASRAAAGLTAELTPAAREEVESVFAKLYPLVRSLPRAGYAGLHRARALSARLDQPLQPGDDVVDVLNAGWLARIRYGEADPVRIANLGRRVLELCQEAVRT